MKQTQNYNIEYQETQDFIDINGIGEAFIAIDRILKSLNDSIEGKETFSVVVVSTLPTESISEKILYLIPDEEDKCFAYIRKNGKWKQLISKEADLSGYYTKTEVNTAISTAIEESITSVLGGEY